MKLSPLERRVLLIFALIVALCALLLKTRHKP